jgi:hypothetical protein
MRPYVALGGKNMMGEAVKQQVNPPLKPGPPK